MIKTHVHVGKKLRFSVQRSFALVIQQWERLSLHRLAWSLDTWTRSAVDPDSSSFKTWSDSSTLGTLYFTKLLGEYHTRLLATISRARTIFTCCLWIEIRHSRDSVNLNLRHRRVFAKTKTFVKNRNIYTCLRRERKRYALWTWARIQTLSNPVESHCFMALEPI